MEDTKKWLSDNITDMSYTNKDFISIYSELLDLTKKLSDKWDPSLSNESDPGVLLLKLNALVADKNNYNIDKNILENFPISVTQEGNARQIYNLVGYHMHWYKSATTKLNFQLTKNTNIDSSHPAVIPEFTVLTNDEGDCNYTLLNTVRLVDSKEIISAKAIEGTPKDYQINESSIITINNLDSDNRLYFTENMIAENGIFVKDYSENDPTFNIPEDNFTANNSLWKQVNNIASYTNLGEDSTTNKIYEFGITPKTNRCYLQFPDDVASNIRNGLVIKYIISQGKNGNTKSNTIDKFESDITTKGVDDSDIVLGDIIKITQPESTTNGSDPESLTSAYNNYKKTIGTFDTLITKRDYENYSYNKTNPIGSPYISNIVVSDRTDDINYSDYMQLYVPNKEEKTLLIKNNKLNAYNIVLYTLRNVDNINSASDYDESFYQESNPTELIDTYDEVKSSQHDIIWDFNEFDKYLFMNIYRFNGTILTYNKLTSQDAKEIKENVTKALYLRFNSRNLNFGEELSYEELVNTIVGADVRIRNIVLNTPTYATYKMNPKKIDHSENKFELIDPSKNTTVAICNELVARMFLSGNVQLFAFDDSFQYELNEKEIHIYPTEEDNYIKSITTSTTKDVVGVSQNNPIQINENEAVQILQPSLVTKTEYAFAYVTVNFNYTSNTTIQLNNEQYITIKVKNQNIEIKNGFMKCSLSLTANKETYLTSGNSLYIQDLNYTELNERTKCYFILNSTALEEDGTYSSHLEIDVNSKIVLQENEYFIYTDVSSNNLIILGSGTLLQNLSTVNKIDMKAPRLSTSQLTDLNINSNIRWQSLSEKMKVVEMSLTTLGNGSSFYFGEGDKLVQTLNNSLQELNCDLIYTIDNKNTTIKKSSSIEYPNLIRTRLYINATASQAQLLKTGQKFEFEFIREENGSSSKPIEGTSDGIYVSFNEPLVNAGGENIDVSVLDEYGKIKYSLKAFSYLLDNGFPDRTTSGLLEIKGNFYDLKSTDNKYKKGVVSRSQTTSTLTYTLGLNSISREKDNLENYLIPVYVNLPEGEDSTTEVYFSVDNKTLKIFNPTSSPETEAIITKNSSLNKSGFMLKIPYEGASNFKINVKNGTSDAIITVGYIVKLNGLNTKEINVESDDLNRSYFSYPYKIEDNLSKVYEYVSTISGDYKDKINWIYRVSEEDKVLQPTSPKAFFNSNHIYNKYTIAKLDFDNISLQINPSSIY